MFSFTFTAIAEDEKLFRRLKGKISWSRTIFWEVQRCFI